MQLRDAVTEDAGSIADLGARAWRVAFQGIAPSGRPDAPALPPGAEEIVRVADDDGVLTGYVAVAAIATANAGELTIYVDPGRWGQGIGRALMGDAARLATEAGYAQLRLWTFERNAQARAFCARLGWTRSGEVDSHEQSGAPAVELARSLG